MRAHFNVFKYVVVTRQYAFGCFVKICLEKARCVHNDNTLTSYRYLYRYQDWATGIPVLNPGSKCAVSYVQLEGPYVT